MGAPAVVAIAFAAAATTVAGVQYVTAQKAARNQFTVDSAAAELQREQGRLQGAEAGLQHATQFRKALASQVALASLRGGAGSVARQFTTESYGNFLKDQEAIKRGVRLSDIQAMHNSAQAYGNKYARGAQNLTQFASTAINSAYSAYTFGGFGAKAPTTTPTTTGGK